MLHWSVKDTRKPRGCSLFSWLYLVNPCYLNLLRSDGAVPDMNPASEMLSQCVAFSVQASAITTQKQFHNICRTQKDLGGGKIGIFQRNFYNFLMFFFSGLNLSVGSAPGSVISQSLQQ